MKIDKRSLGDAILSIVGGVIGGVAFAAYAVHRYMNTPVQGAPQGVPDDQVR